MVRKLGLVIAGLSLAMVSSSVPASAHHAFAAEFDAKKPVLFKGTVTKMEWINPHVWIHIDVKQDNGSVEQWMVEGGAPNVLYKRGFTKASLLPGVQVVVDGYRAKDGSKKMNAREITFSDGKRLFAGSSGTGAAQ
jgi:hypothetical protein